MKHFRKFSAVMLAAVLILAAGCGPNGEEQMQPLHITPLAERANVSRALAGRDALGRKVEPAGENRNGEKLVGLFYVLWLGNDYADGDETSTPYFDGIYDLSKLPFEEAYSPSGTPFLRMHFYAEPLFGYYNMRDRWVVERHIQMFIAADIDFLAIDSTNWSIYPTVLPVLLDVLEEYRLLGYKVPKIMFLTNTESNVRVNRLYETLYRDGRYRELWFTDSDGGRNPEGKPWVSMRADQRAYLPQAVRNTFYFKDSQWPNESFKDNGMPWIEFERPQRSHNGIVSVSVAQNAGMHMSDSVQFEDSPNEIDYYNRNWGRGYTDEGKNDKSRVNEGANFQEQWDNAMALDPHIVLVTEWNEWSALKLSDRVPGFAENQVVYFDCANVEFSRDIEPIKGYYGDNFYLQLIQNIRRFKGSEGEGIEMAERTVDIFGDGKSWEGVTSGVSDFAGEAVRNFQNTDGSGVYLNETKRNDITELRVCRDYENYYFLIGCDQRITDPSDDRWMNLWLRTSDSADGSYQYVINRSRSGKKASVERLTPGGSQRVGEADILLNGSHLQIRLPKSLLALDPAFGLEVKVTDNVDPLSDVMSLYTTGDSAPYGRLNYRFV